MMNQANSGSGGDSVDRISDLPDSTLSHILSLIPTKNAVATSVLSKRWKFLWKAVHNLDFSLDFCQSYCCKRCHEDCNVEQAAEEDMKFAQFVNHVLLLHDDGFLNKFSLVWKPICIPSQVISWISYAITSNIHELFLCVDNPDKPFEIPSSVFSCQTLKSLELNGNLFVSDPNPIAVCLPSLERLKLVSIYFHSDQTFQNLISGCPVLKSLFVEVDLDIMSDHIQTYRDTGTNHFTFIITSTSLRRFVLDVESEDEFLCSLKLVAPSLEYIHLKGFVSPQIFAPERLRSLVKANLSITISENDISNDTICNSLVEAIRAFDCAKSLRLSDYLLKALSCATIGLSTKFKRLTKLKTRVNRRYCSSLQDFIQNSDCLEVLIIDKDSDSTDYNYYNDPHSNWTTPMEVPMCLSNSLKTVKFDNYGGFYFEREMIRYMLMHGSVLEVIRISCYVDRADLRLKLFQELNSFPRKSPACIIKFSRRG